MTQEVDFLTFTFHFSNILFAVNAGATGDDQGDSALDEPSSKSEKARERAASHDSERSCPPMSKKKKVVEITDPSLEASWSKIFNFFIDHLQDLKTVNGIQAIPYLQVGCALTFY